MPYRRLRFIVLMLAVLTLTMEGAHVLELPQKMRYSAELYSAVNTTMYRYFAVVGGPLTVLTLLVGTALVLVLRGQPGFLWTLAGVLGYYIAFVIWLTAVAPVNSQIAAAVTRAPDVVPELWMKLRVRWEYGHAVGFALQFIGLASLLWSVLAPRSDISSGDVVG
jgi:hypothetical protein